MSLPPLLAEGLDVVFVGTQPGNESVRLGCYYANRSNRFYQHLFETGFTPVVLSPTQFRELLSHGIGLDDVYDDPAALRQRLLAAAPRAVCFNAARHARASRGF
jgi:TDG/mug DNA glycosylase family protein